MKAKLQTTIFQRQMADGDQMDFSANGIYLLHVKKLCAMLAKVGGREAAWRKLAFKSLWRCAGRASEVGSSTWR